MKSTQQNSQTISSYPVRFPTDIFFSSLLSFAFCLFVIFFFFFFYLKIFILIHIGLCRRVIDFSRPISGNKTIFLALFNIFDISVWFLLTCAQMNFDYYNFGNALNCCFSQTDVLFTGLETFNFDEITFFCECLVFKLVSVDTNGYRTS